MEPICLSFAISAILCNAALPARSIIGSELIDGVPAYLYDPKTASPRRRPGHPYPASERGDQNTGNTNPSPVDAVGESIPVPDRWRIMESLGLNYPWYDPYHQNLYKGDKPIHDDWFLSLLGISDTIIEPRSIPTPVGAQASNNPGSNDIFSGINQTILAQTFLAGLVYFKGDTTFKPPEYEYRLTLAANYNRVDVSDVRALQIDPRLGTARDDGFLALQEAFVDKHLRNVSERYDFDAIRFGIQPITVDFRGFLFQDNQLGIRLFGNRDNNKRQYNLAWFRRLEKDTNSGLNDVTQGLRHDEVFIANFYQQDTPYLGFTSQVALVYNRNRELGSYYNNNGFIERPAPIGRESPRQYDVTYLGYNGDGHLGNYNLSVSSYFAVGKNDSVFTGRRTNIRAGFAAAELSRDFDWIRARASGLYASGDKDPFDDRSSGFDAIQENPIFAGADTSYWIRQNIPLIGGGGVGLSGRNGVLASLRSSKDLGQSNFDNPGLRLIGVGADLDLTPASRVSLNLNQLWFDNTKTLEVLRNQSTIRRGIGTDASVAWIYRPLFSQNVVLRMSGALLEPASGLKDLFGKDDRYYSVLANFILTY
jgi:hypothetical protein